MLLPLLVAVSLVVGLSRTSIAQNPGDPVTVQFGSYFSPTANAAGAPFTTNRVCEPGQTQDCDVETYVYSADLFASALGANQAIQINSFTFFTAVLSAEPVAYFPNYYNVYMGVAGGPLSFFGIFPNGNAICGTLCSYTCDAAPSPTCMPEGFSGVGSYLYDPNLGNLQVTMVETLDASVALGAPYWYDQGQLVTRFDGVVTSTPEPSTIVLAGSGFLSVLGFARRRRRSAA
jgi:hypothetical protein